MIRKLFKVNFEKALISDHKVAIWALPFLAAFSLITAIWGAGLLGNPDLPVDSIKERHMDELPLALQAADKPTYDEWDGPSPEMSGFIRSELIQQLKGAKKDPGFEGKSFVSSPDLQPIEEGGISASADVRRAITGASDALATSRAALDQWTQDYWCSRRAWEEPWLGEIVRPLIARGTGSCTGWQRFSAGSPLISSTSTGWGLFSFFLLCLVTAISVVLFISQIALREAYRMQYRSKLFP